MSIVKFPWIIKAVKLFCCFFFTLLNIISSHAPSAEELSPHTQEVSPHIQEVSLQFQWKHQFEFAGFYAAKEKGYYQDAGLKVTFHEYHNEMELIDDVIEGKKDFGVGPSSVIIERLEGKPIRLLANYFKRSPLVIAAKPEIKFPGDLYHKKLMITEKDLNNPNIKHMLAFADIEPEDLSIIQHSFDINDFIQGKVDAVTIFITNEAFELNRKKIPHTIINPNIYGGISFDANLFTSETTALASPSMVLHFRDASNKGWLYALEHIDEMVDLILTKYNTQNKSRAQLLFEAKEIKKIMLPTIYPVGSLSPGQNWYGSSINNNEMFSLTVEEREFLKSHPVIRVSNEMDWIPFDFCINREPHGYSVDLMHILEKHIGVKFIFVNGYSWAQLLQLFKEKRIDLIQSSIITRETEQYTLFSDPYLSYQNGFVVPEESHEIPSIDDFFYKTIAVPWKSAQAKFLKSTYPRIDLLYTNDNYEAFEKVMNGEADAAIENKLTMLYMQGKRMTAGLKNSGWFKEMDNGRVMTLHLGIRNDWPLFLSIINKFLKQITPGEINSLDRKWFGGSLPMFQEDKISSHEELMLSKRNNISTDSIEILKKDETIQFTNEEIDYLKKKGTIKMCVLPDWLPYESINKDGEHQGIGAEMMKIISRRINTPIELLPTREWGESLQKMRARKCDILPLAMDVPSRQDAMNFTKPYIVEPFVIATHNSELFIKDIKDIGNRAIGVIKNYAFTEVLKQFYPNLNIIHVKNARDGLEKVRSEDIFGYIDSMPTIGYTLQKYSMMDLKIAGKLEFDLELSIASRSDEPLLASIMQKAADSITEEERRRIISKWLSVKFEQGFNYALFWKFLAGSLIILLGIGYWNRTLLIEIKKRKEMEKHLEHASREALAASKAKGDFLANMSHEIRTPMNAIIGMSALALNKDFSGDAQRYFKNINTSGQSLLGIINDILDFSKIEAGKIEIEKTPFSLREILENIVVIFEPAALEKGLDFNLLIDEKIPEHFMGDPNRIKQIITNFTGNALKFTSQGSVTIKVEAIDVMQDGQKVKISVMDTGKGISKENHDKLFKAFTQEDISTTRTYGGTGLGLAISKLLAEMMGGKIGFESQADQGSVFHITLDMQFASVVQFDGNIMITSNIHGARILIVDDEHYSREMLKETINSFSFTLDEAPSAEKALQMMETASTPYDLILLDWKMPNKSGTSFYQELRHKHTHIRLPKAILISAYNNPELIDEAREAGITTVLTKPVKPSDLLVSIVNSLGKEILVQEINKNQSDINKVAFMGQTILLVEDNSLNQEVCQEILEMLRLNVMIANNGQEAVECFEKNCSEIDLVLMDLQMPVLDGYGASQKIRKLPSSSNIPIIALSADAISGTREKAIASGMNDYTTKPIVPSNLIKTLMRYLDYQQLEVSSIRKESNENSKNCENRENSFPKISGIDTEQGIANRMGNAESYKKVLLKFSKNYRTFVQECIEAYNQNDFKNLVKSLHTFKGVTGNIQATEISALTMKIEVMAKNNNHECTYLLKELDNKVETLCRDIEKTLSHIPDSPYAKPVISSENLTRKLEDIMRLLLESDTKARSEMEILLSIELPHAIQSCIEAAAEAINGYDFDEAIAYANDALKRLKNE
ncbi:putative SENSORY TRANSDUCTION HISTIDINE KINASE [Desulfamplus magnetovallimortis]|uniref:histidine kinase n=1 Tax=Desulfamplus magnetovallimortis TaxID=1246637 RepID=A0A1W1HKC6_9BACT|nr:transporter substrate-binding domain-containing protein [Desulfamplus magnetovallimortis]SLM32913.1 putative SENSORY TRANSDUCTION HISTIDINE KINASE [Desulfamplus magnetovallimortis]